MYHEIDYYAWLMSCHLFWIEYEEKYIYTLPPRDSSPGGEAFVMVSNSEARSTWHDVTSHDNKPKNE